VIPFEHVEFQRMFITKETFQHAIPAECVQTAVEAEEMRPRNCSTHRLLTFFQTATSQADVNWKAKEAVQEEIRNLKITLATKERDLERYDLAFNRATRILNLLDKITRLGIESMGRFNSSTGSLTLEDYVTQRDYSHTLDLGNLEDSLNKYLEGMQASHVIWGSVPALDQKYELFLSHTRTGSFRPCEGMQSVLTCFVKMLTCDPLIVGIDFFQILSDNNCNICVEVRTTNLNEAINNCASRIDAMHDEETQPLEGEPTTQPLEGEPTTHQKVLGYFTNENQTIKAHNIVLYVCIGVLFVNVYSST